MISHFKIRRFQFQLFGTHSNDDTTNDLLNDVLVISCLGIKDILIFFSFVDKYKQRLKGNGQNPGMYIKPGIQERRTECGKRGE